VESTLFLYFLFHLLSEAFYYENNLSFDIVLIAKPKLRRDYIFMIHQEQLRFNKKIKFNFKGGDLTSDAGLLLDFFRELRQKKKQQRVDKQESN
jgi:type II secretory pathway predicted ATPase ExeA